MKNQKGITLVALVITIIVMLILVVVTINIATDGGLFDTARNAANDTNTAAKEEQRLKEGLVQDSGNNTVYYEIEDFAQNGNNAVQKNADGSNKVIP